MKRTLRATCILAVALAALGTGGCEGVADWFKTDQSRLLSPYEVVNASETSPINPILPSVTVVDPAQELPPNATFPREGDWEYSDKDYVIGPSDIVDIGILDLFQEGMETVLRREVGASGFIDLPLLPERIRAEGLTKDELTAAVIAAYSPTIIREPTVSVTIVSRSQTNFSVLGAVQRPGTYNMIRKDMRLLEGLALSGGINTTNLTYIYVIRPNPPIRTATTAPARPAAVAPAIEAPPSSEFLPPTQAPAAPAEGAMPAAPMNPQETKGVESALEELRKAMGGQAESQPVPAPSELPRLSDMAQGASSQAASVPTTQSEETAEETTPLPEGAPATYRWLYTNGKWTKVAQGNLGESQTTSSKPIALEKSLEEPATSAVKRSRGPEEDVFHWAEAEKFGNSRLIAIRLDKLQTGDPRMNIVVHENDVIYIPILDGAEFYVTGEVLRPGVYSLTGRKITVKMAMAAAGSLSGLAWPENSILIRRIGDNQEQIVPINIEAIYKGEEPDIFLKPNDVIAVGTDVRAIFFAVMRNAFRMTWGFGFIYDRNFAEPAPQGLDDKRFTRW
jgi:protein involved in polysaccharide export with SLBB domain